MINRVQVLWYLNKDDLENYCLDFKPYKSHKLEGYEICEVDEDLIFDLCDRDPDRFIPHSITETENPIRYTKNMELIKTDITITPGLSPANEEQIEYKTEKTLKTPIIANLL